MGVYAQILKEVKLPKLAPVRQSFPMQCLADLDAAIAAALTRDNTLNSIKPGDRVALTVGSRGIHKLSEITAYLVRHLQAQGTEVVLIPAMGSHGGATPMGQREVLLGLGIDPQALDVKVEEGMAVVQVGTLSNGLPVFTSRAALEVDKIVLLNRIKPHTAFRGSIESGLIKMLSIGLGKQKGAEACHAYGFGQMAENLVAMGEALLNKLPIAFGLGIVENAYDQTHSIFAIPGDRLLAEEPQWLALAKGLMPKLPVQQLDVLVIDEIGKDISGDGADPNITGRYPTDFASGGPEVSKIALLDLTAASYGNANGIGTADFAAQRLVSKMIAAQTYPNALTSTVTGPVKIPLTLQSDKEVIQAAIKTSNARDFSQIRLIRIKNTLNIAEFWASEALLREFATQQLEVGELRNWDFNEAGNLF